MKTKILTVFSISALSISCVLTVFAFAKSSAPQEPMDSLVLAMSTDNTEVVDGAITIGTVALKRGHEVIMLLRLDSIKVAVAKNNYPVENTTLAKKLSAFMNSGAKVIAGGKCMQIMKLKPADLINDVQVGTPDMVMGALFRKDTKILSY